ncbi:hypothetical protein L1987_38727 [Smallanthus sonchifolius]|uniref:Uncharacterized protein n=1 Tax=Smallanthus sonchifolius TaxID=185202 RepID=A0ACB9HJS4_9ASTR|nr:hypothetical protein L1987_38727 [Smallanthus sonchifolius]
MRFRHINLVNAGTSVNGGVFTPPGFRQLNSPRSLLMDPKAVRNLNQPVSSLMVNGSGIYLFGSPESNVAIRVLITPAAANSDYRILKMSTDGQLVVMRYANTEWVTDFSTPGDSCRPPSRCGKLGLCSPGGCYCPVGFRTAYSVCALSDNSLSLPESCGDNKTLRQSNSPENFTYVQLAAGMKYYPLDFLDPVRNSVVLSTCKALCSASCSCLAFFYGNQSGSCHLIENNLGSVTSSSNNVTDDKLGFVKTISSSQNQDGNSNSHFPVVGLILLPTTGVLVVSVFAILLIRRTKNNKMKRNSNNLDGNSYSDDLDMFSIAVRFDHEDLVEATVNFSTPIGSGCQDYRVPRNPVCLPQVDCGTHMYLAPEWLTSVAISDRADVYSYGMVLLELIHGRKNCEQALSHGSGNPSTSIDDRSSISSGSHNRPHACALYFPLQALEMHEEGLYLHLVEPRLAGLVTSDEAEKLVKVALCCLHEDTALRPKMANVVAMLEGTLPVSEPRLESLSFLRFYGRGFTSQ